MPPPDLPSVWPTSPHVRNDERPTAILAQDGGGHFIPVQDHGSIPFDVDDRLVDYEAVDDVIVEDLQPPRARHHSAAWLHEHEREVIIKNRLRQCPVSSLDTGLEALRRRLEVVVCHERILT